MEHYDIFISYRRRGGSEKAELLKAVFEKRGFKEERIFMDTHALKGGDFTVKLKNAITESTNIIVLITKGCFEQIKNDDFWVYEISQALEQRKNIIPVYFDGITQIDGKDLPDVLRHLPNQNAVSYVHEYADACYDKICSFMVSEGSYSPKESKKTQTLNNHKRGCVITLSITLVIMMGLFFIIPSANQEPDPKVIAQADPIPFPPSSPDNTSEPYHGNHDGESIVYGASRSEEDDEYELKRGSKPDRRNSEEEIPLDGASAPRAKTSTAIPPSSPAPKNRSIDPSLTIKEVERIIISGKPSSKIPDETIIAVNGEKMDYRTFRAGVAKKILADIKVTSIIDNETIVVTASVKHEDLERLRQNKRSIP